MKQQSEEKDDVRSKAYGGRGGWIVVSLVALTACSSNGYSTSRAEQVDAQVSLRVRFASGQEAPCRKNRCEIHFAVEVTTDSVDGVWARNCSLLVLDRDGHVLTTAPLGLGFPAGIFTQAGTTSHASGNTEVVIPKRAQDRIDGLDAWCRAYVWHGEPPI
jgi:hypothetical protein